VALAPSVAKVTDVASFVRRIVRSSPIGDGDRVAPRSDERTKRGNLSGENLGIVRVAQDIDVGLIDISVLSKSRYGRNLGLGEAVIWRMS
jgi:hypothetical protein